MSPLPLAAAACFWAGVSGVRALGGARPKSASTSIEPPNATSRDLRRPDMNVFCFARSSMSAATLVCQVALDETTAFAELTSPCMTVMTSAVLYDAVDHDRSHRGSMFRKKPSISFWSAVSSVKTIGEFRIQ